MFGYESCRIIYNWGPSYTRHVVIETPPVILPVILQNGTKLRNSSLIAIQKDIDFSEITDWAYMFYDNTLLRSFPTTVANPIKVVGSALGMCTTCSALQSIPPMDLSECTNMGSMFLNCAQLKGLTGQTWNTSKVTNMNSAFYNCIQVTDLPAMDASSVISATNAFNMCVNLRNFGGLQNMNISYSLATCGNLTVESLLNCLNGLSDLTGKTSQTLTLGSTNLSKLTQEQIAIATSKNWSIV